MSLVESITAPGQGSAPTDLVTETSKNADATRVTDSALAPTSFDTSSTTPSPTAQAKTIKAPLLTPAQTAGIAIGGVATAVIVFLFVAALASCWHRRKMQVRSKAENADTHGRFGPPAPPREDSDSLHEKAMSQGALQNPEITAAYPKMMDSDYIGVAVSSENTAANAPPNAVTAQFNERLVLQDPPPGRNAQSSNWPSQSQQKNKMRPESAYTYIDEKRASMSTIGATGTLNPPSPVRQAFDTAQPKVVQDHVEPKKNMQSKASSLTINVPPTSGPHPKAAVPIIKRQKPDRDSVATLIQEDPMSPGLLKNGEKVSSLHVLRPPRDAPFDYIPSYYYTQQPGAPAASLGLPVTFSASVPHGANRDSHGLACLPSPASTTTTLVNPTSPPPSRPPRATPPPAPSQAYTQSLAQYNPYKLHITPPSAYHGTTGPTPRPVRSTPPPPRNQAISKYQQPPSKSKPPPTKPKALTLAKPKSVTNRNSTSSFTSFETTQSDAQPPTPFELDDDDDDTAQHVLTPVRELATPTASTATSPISNIRYPSIPRPANQAIDVYDKSKWHLQESPTRAGRQQREQHDVDIEPPRPSPRQVIRRQQQKHHLLHLQTSPPPPKITLPGPPSGPPPQLKSPPQQPRPEMTTRKSSDPQSQSQSHTRETSTSTSTTSTLASKRQGEPLATSLQKQLWITASNGRTTSISPPNLPAPAKATTKPTPTQTYIHTTPPPPPPLDVTKRPTSSHAKAETQQQHPKRSSSRRRIHPQPSPSAVTEAEKQVRAGQQDVHIPAPTFNEKTTQVEVQLKSPPWEPRLTPRRGPGGDLVIEVT